MQKVGSILLCFSLKNEFLYLDKSLFTMSKMTFTTDFVKKLLPTSMSTIHPGYIVAFWLIVLAHWHVRMSRVCLDISRHWFGFLPIHSFLYFFQHGSPSCFPLPPHSLIQLCLIHHHFLLRIYDIVFVPKLLGFISYYV